jgi:predicted cobalt transporter CbtA
MPNFRVTVQRTEVREHTETVEAPTPGEAVHTVNRLVAWPDEDGFSRVVRSFPHNVVYSYKLQDSSVATESD